MSRCRWLERDAEGRPRCEHGWAIHSGSRWRCREKHRLNNLRYGRTEKGRVAKARSNATPAAIIGKQLYDLCRPPRLL